MKLSNRFVRSATWEAMATDSGAATSRLIDLMAGIGCHAAAGCLDPGPGFDEIEALAMAVFQTEIGRYIVAVDHVVIS